MHSLAGVQGDLLCLRTAISFCIYVSGAIEPIAVGVPVHGELCDVLHTFAEFFEAWTEQVAPKAGKSLWSPYDKVRACSELVFTIVSVSFVESCGFVSSVTLHSRFALRRLGTLAPVLLFLWHRLTHRQRRRLNC